jgi:hypothetical protein
MEDSLIFLAPVIQPGLSNSTQPALGGEVSRGRGWPNVTTDLPLYYRIVLGRAEAPKQIFVENMREDRANIR